jgi:hypothetical protein
MADRPKFGAQLTVGVMMIACSALGLLQAFVALRHHAVLWNGGRGPNYTWMDPWQAIFAWSLFGSLGAYCLVSAIRKRRSG